MVKITRGSVLGRCLAIVAAVGLLVLPAAGAAQAVSPPTPVSSPRGDLRPVQQWYVSLGDSYAVGYQPTFTTGKYGFVYQTVPLARARGYNFKVAQFGCGGATTESLLGKIGCKIDPARPFDVPDFHPYPTTTQIAAATSFIRAHRGHIGLITVSIGGNDVTACAKSANPIPCIAAATARIRTDVTRITKQLRAAAGPGVLIVGTTYPDVVLGQWVNPGGASGRALANLSLVGFKTFINPALKAAYASGGARFVDVTAATGAYGPMSVKQYLAPWGLIPKPVAKVCQLTWYCTRQDIHPHTAGYSIIAGLVAGQLPRKR